MKLRNLRIVPAILFFVALTALFLDFTGTLHAYLGWTARLQLLPALLAANVAVVVGLVVLTLLVGRVYCSVICPLGVMQDIVSWLNSRLGRKRRYRFGYTPAHNRLRYGVLVLFVAALAAGVAPLVALLAPYSAYGRMASNLLAPLYRWGNNALAYLAERADSYAFYSVEVKVSALLTVVALLTFVVIATLAWRGGRTYCNTICPVGTVLGFVSRFALLRPVINTDKCKNCSLCARRCKASCIDFKHHRIDYSRCVACMDCIDECTHGAIRLRSRLRTKPLPATEAPRGVEEQQMDSARRLFLASLASAGTASALRAQEKKVDGGLAVIEDKQVPRRTTPIVPPGAWSARHFAHHCTACQLCVAGCPSGVLRPSTDPARLMQPEAGYESGYCRPECTHCSDVCPTGAIRPISREEKSSVRIGHAVWVRKNCIPLTDGVECGNCARHCPAGAIQMVPSAGEGSVRIPVVNVERCIGCGACEHLCPARPFSAIYVEGHTEHSVL